MAEFFPGFEQRRIKTSGAEINLVTGDSGPPLLLLHGYPEMHAMWRNLAPRLAEEFTLLITDLRGYGDSSKPPAGPDFAAYSKRALAQDQVETMARSASSGSGSPGTTAARGSRTGSFATIPAISTGRRCSTPCRRSTASRPSTRRRRAAGASVELFLRKMLGLSGTPGAHEPVGLCRIPALLRQSGDDPHHLRRIPRRRHDRSRARPRRSRSQSKNAAPRAMGRAQRPGSGYDMLAVWREHAENVTGEAIKSGHFLPEERPDETYRALRAFLAAD